MAETIHIGRKISKIRELRGIKQETLATELGISQQAVSKIEQSADVEEEALGKIAKVLGVTPEAIKNFSEEAVVNYFNTFNDNSTNNGAVYAFNSAFNPIDKLVEVYEENKKLYEQLLASALNIVVSIITSVIASRLYQLYIDDRQKKMKKPNMHVRRDRILGMDCTKIQPCSIRITH